MSVHSEIGGTVRLPRWKAYAQAREIAALAQVALECSVEGPGSNLPRALAQFDRIRAILGTQQAD